MTKDASTGRTGAGMTTKPRYAPSGEIWVCPACGRTGRDRYNMGDTSCMTHAVLCLKDSIVRKDGRVVSAKASNN